MSNNTLGVTDAGTIVENSEHAGTRSLLMSGLSGLGKTQLMMLLILLRILAGEVVVWLGFNHNNKFDNMPERLRSVYERNVDRYDARKVLPLPWIYEDEDITEALASDIANDFAVAFRLSRTRQAAVKDAIRYIIKKKTLLNTGLDDLIGVLDGQKDNASQVASATLSSFLEEVNIRNNATMLQNVKGKIIEIDCSSLSFNNQIPAITLFLEVLFRRIDKGDFAEHGITIVIDEAQNMRFGDGTALKNLMQISRKMGASILLATVSSPVETKGIIAEASKYISTKIYFRHDDMSCYNLAKKLFPNDYRIWTNELRSLKRGEYVVTGNLVDSEGNPQDSSMILKAPMDYVLAQYETSEKETRSADNGRGIVRMPSTIHMPGKSAEKGGVNGDM